MGTVVLAQQESPRRDVAIKIMNPGVVSRKALRRFEFEAHTLGRLQHPAIAQVYEAGTFDDGSGGRPYFAMEYVSSAKELGDYVTDKQLDTVARLELFRAFCEGVEYGHRRGVIHRDLKPGNILVDAEGHPKIIDFGVARSTESDSVTATLATEAGQLIGTLQYMSPEQVELDPGDLDTRSDVYALGVILYQLLVDKLPYDLTGASLTKAGQLIKETQPARLSDINSNLHGDLETICLKALEKDRDQRYQSVGDLSDDIRRYLADEPIMARPPTRAEQFRRLVRKNKAAAVATGVVAAALIAATTISIVFAVEAGRQRIVAEERAAQIEEKTAEVQKQADEMKVMLDFQTEQISSINAPAMGASLRDQMVEQFGIDPELVRDVDFTGTSVALINDHILEPTLSAINEQFADQPLAQSELLQKLSLTLRGFTLLDEAMVAQQQALDLRRDILGNRHEDTAYSIWMMGSLLNLQARYGDSVEHFSEAADIYRDILGGDDDTVLSVEQSKAMSLVRVGRYDEANLVFDENLSRCRDKHGDMHPATADALLLSAFGYSKQGKVADAFRCNLQALDILLPSRGRDSCAVLFLNTGSTLRKLGRYEEAREYVGEALEITRRLGGDKYNPTLWSLNSMGSILRHQGEFDQAMEYTSRAFENRREVLGEEHQQTLQSKNAMGRLLCDMGRHDEAMVHLVDALESQRRILGPLHSDTMATMHDLGWLHHRMGRHAESVVVLSRALDGQRQSLWDGHPERAQSALSLSRVMASQGEFDSAMPYGLEALEVLRGTLGEDNPLAIQSLEAVIELHDEWHQVEPEDGHDAKADEYRVQLDAITARAEEPVAP